ncbi:phosphotransferase family protein [Bacillus capparidis]|uniref:Aminoglycoside phosphotransferase (APT) family kinase protein n=1 Tax=Bacillus capparidis TaxID=1840411 RepID=A0ABS4CYY3_9BACI|nr:aminoglycoside phosphotransferase family protein [Bacillus capparidis]MBP1082553.1 aminoglycoside phosphotransferase (APT) family kinase protein [Bacillus capparidis]MED1097217.1 aminoglycoside phosphotransferase family protein [Bacillus capparidis]
MKKASGHMLPDRVLKWVIQSVGPDASIQSIQELHGGMSSLVHRISVGADHSEKEFVLRLFTNADWLRAEPDLALHEAESLRVASRTGVQTPHIIAFDETGIECGVPAVLMTKLEGTVELRPESMTRWVNELADALVKIHSIEADDFPWTYFTYHDIASLEIPGWSSVPDLWKSAIEILKGPRPESKECFIHRDYHPTNVLWSENTVSGVVDWVNSCKGPAGIDVGHCRVNLAMLFGIQTADLFLSAYENSAGLYYKYDPYWDILSLADIVDGPPEVYPGWPAFGVTGLTDKLIMERLDRYLISLLERI